MPSPPKLDQNRTRKQFPSKDMKVKNRSNSRTYRRQFPWPLSFSSSSNALQSKSPLHIFLLFFFTYLPQLPSRHLHIIIIIIIIFTRHLHEQPPPKGCPHKQIPKGIYTNKFNPFIPPNQPIYSTIAIISFPKIETWSSWWV